MKKLFLTALLFSFSLIFLQAADKVEFPENFPEEWKTKEFISHEKRDLDKGVTYYKYHFKDFRDGEPLSMHFITVDWNKANAKFVVGVAKEGTLQTVPEMVASDKKESDEVLCAINGAYFHFKPAASYFAIKGSGKLHDPGQAPNRFSDGAIVSSGAEFPTILKPSEEIMAKYDNLLQGYWLGRDGVNIRATFRDKEENNEEKKDRTPYTIVGTNPKKKLLVLFVNDGRHKQDSPGLSFNETSDFLFKLGCTQSLSIDGGGSSTMALPAKNKSGKLEVVNNPSDNRTFDNKGARRVQNCIYIVKNKEILKDTSKN